MTRDARIAVRVTQALKDQITAATVKTGMDEPLLVVEAMRAVTKFVEDNGRIFLPLRVVDRTGTGSGSDWREEKARNVVSYLCTHLHELKRSRERLNPFSASPEALAQADTPGIFQPILWDATKLFCEAAADGWGRDVGVRWSPRLVRSLMEMPEKCDKALDVIGRREFLESDLWRVFGAESESEP